MQQACRQDGAQAPGEHAGLRGRARSAANKRALSGHGAQPPSPAARSGQERAMGKHCSQSTVKGRRRTEEGPDGGDPRRGRTEATRFERRPGLSAGAPRPCQRRHARPAIPHAKASSEGSKTSSPTAGTGATQALGLPRRPSGISIIATTIARRNRLDG